MVKTPKFGKKYKTTAKSANNAVKRAVKKSFKKAVKAKVDDANELGETLGMILGGVAGSAIVPGPIGGLGGAAIGKSLGGKAQKMFRNVTGLGDYKIGTNTILGTSAPPIMHGGNKNGEVRIKHREYFADVVTGPANTFQTQSYAINPGNPSLFPWLSPIALQFQEWSPCGIVIEYVTTSSDALNSTNTALGTVGLSTFYNSNQPLPINLKQMLNTEFAISGKPSQNLLHAVECDPKRMVCDSLYVTTSSNGVNDLRFMNVGNFMVSTSGFQAPNVVVGQLWITYDIALRKMKIGQRGPNFGAHFEANIGVSAPNDSDIFNQYVMQSSSNLDVVLGKNTIVFPSWYEGNVQVALQYYGATGVSDAYTVTGTNGAVPLNTINGDASQAFAVVDGGTVLTQIAYWSILPVGDGTSPTLTFSGGAIPSGLISSDVFVQSVQNSN